MSAEGCAFALSCYRAKTNCPGPKACGRPAAIESMDARNAARGRGATRWDGPVRPQQVSEKRCSVCGVVKPASEFYVRNKHTGALSYQCKACRSIKAKMEWKRKKEGQANEANRRARRSSAGDGDRHQGASAQSA